jgi:hypothetical protein
LPSLPSSLSPSVATMSQSKFLPEEYSKSTTRQQKQLYSMLLLVTWLQPEKTVVLMAEKG